jgi:hypothetical protein
MRGRLSGSRSRAPLVALTGIFIHGMRTVVTDGVAMKRISSAFMRTSAPRRRSSTTIVAQTTIPSGSRRRTPSRQRSPVCSSPRTVRGSQQVLNVVVASW